jgi:hypothetical protein
MSISQRGSRSRGCISFAKGVRLEVSLVSAAPMTSRLRPKLFRVVSLYERHSALSWPRNPTTSSILLQSSEESQEDIYNGDCKCATNSQARIFVRPSPDFNHARLTLHPQTLLHSRSPPRPTLHRPPPRRIHKILHLRGSSIRRRDSLSPRH